MRLLSSEKSSACDSCRGARRGDLLEIEYTGKLEDGKVFDGSRVMVSELCHPFAGLRPVKVDRQRIGEAPFVSTCHSLVFPHCTCDDIHRDHAKLFFHLA